MSHEHALIDHYLKPLAYDANAFELKDDGALIKSLNQQDYIISKDMLLSGKHFFKNDDPYTLAQKLLRVNISDICAKGATPNFYMLGLGLPPLCNEAWMKRFCEGLKNDQEHFGLSLLGGDTISSNHDIILSLTILGRIEKGKAVHRHTAQENNLIMITGMLGKSAMGLNQLLSKTPYSLEKTIKEEMIKAYHCPQIYPAITPIIRDFATASMDISDGLLSDLYKLCDASKLKSTLHIKHIPYSESFQNHPDRKQIFEQIVLNGGDDYQTLFCIKPKNKEAVLKAASEAKIQLSQIGIIKNQEEHLIISHSGKRIFLKTQGYDHFQK